MHRQWLFVVREKEREDELAQQKDEGAHDSDSTGHNATIDGFGCLYPHVEAQIHYTKSIRQ